MYIFMICHIYNRIFYIIINKILYQNINYIYNIYIIHSNITNS